LCSDNFLFQATLWSNCIKALAGWYQPKQKTTMFGLWGTCTFAGGILGTSLAVRIRSVLSGIPAEDLITGTIFMSACGLHQSIGL